MCKMSKTLKPFNSMHHLNHESITRDQFMKGLEVKHGNVGKQKKKKKRGKTKLSTPKKVFLT